jgi:hypothetical protein
MLTIVLNFKKIKCCGAAAFYAAPASTPGCYLMRLWAIPDPAPTLPHIYEAKFLKWTKVLKSADGKLFSSSYFVQLKIVNRNGKSYKLFSWVIFFISLQVEYQGQSLSRQSRSRNAFRLLRNDTVPVQRYWKIRQKS